jgi:DNA-binding MarR family transcriptional regulator
VSADQELVQTAQCLCLASRRAARAITRAFDRALRAHGLRSTQFSLLAVLTLKGALSISQVADILGADRTTLTRNLGPVEAQGLVRIRQGDDARERVVEVTSKGKATLQRALPAWRKVQSGLTQMLGQEAADSLRQLSRSTRERRPHWSGL